MDRRQFLYFSSSALAASALKFSARNNKGLSGRVRSSHGHVIAVDPSAPGLGDLKLLSPWHGDFCQPKLVNCGKHSVRIREVVLFSLRHDLPGSARLYGESFQMLSQTGGTLEQPLDLGYSEAHHYRLPQPADVTAALSGLVTLSPPGRDHLLLAFTSCKKFIGRFYVRPGSIDAVIDAEGLELAPGESWELEEIMVAEGPRRPQLLLMLANRISSHHPRPLFRPIPTGWCSWYCFGPRVTAQNVLNNLDAISKNIPVLKYIQIDDGYQRAMGDWLETGQAFGGDIVTILKEIRKRGFEPAIWVAPFIAEESSHIFQQHPDWFIRGADGKPLPSNQVTFGGWRHGPWYALDGTHPEVQKHFEEVFGVMRHDWGCTYFKLDANFWGAMHGGAFHDPKATRIEAYRRGMEAIRRGAGESYLLGCNHPIWPSFGLIDGSRSSGDIKRQWSVFARDARQTFNRNWQNGHLWWNDPDAVLLTGELPEDEFQFHATAIYASGGAVLSGDDLTKISAPRLAMLRKLLPPTGVAAEFQDERLQVGVTKVANGVMVSFFNWEDKPQTLSFPLPKRAHISDYWTGEEMGEHEGIFVIKDMAPHSARLLLLE